MRYNPLISKTCWHRMSYFSQNFKAAFNSFSSHWNGRRTLNRCRGAKGLCESIKKRLNPFFFDYHRCLHSSSILISKSSRFFLCVKRQTETNFAICTAKLRTNSICTFKEIKPIISVVQLKEKAVMLLCASHASILSFFFYNQPECIKRTWQVHCNS